MSTMYIYNHKLDVIGYQETDRMEMAQVDMSLNSASILDFATLEELPDYARYVAMQDPIANRRGMTDEYLLFKIQTHTTDGDFHSYTGTEFAYDELAVCGYIKDRRMQNYEFNTMLDIALEGTQWKRGLTNIEGTRSTNFYYISPLEAISAIQEVFSAEWRFWVRLTKGGKIAERIVDAVKHRGQETGKRFETSSNLITVVATDDYSGLYSAIVPRGKGEQVDGDNNPDTPDGYGRRITIEDIEWSVANGDPIDKPLGQEYMILPEGETTVDETPRYQVVIFEDIEDKEVLINSAYETLLANSTPGIQLQAEVINIGNAELGDTIQIVDTAKNIRYTTRVFQITYDYIEPANTTAQFGDDLIGGGSTIDKINTIEKEVAKEKENNNWSIQQADGKNSTYYGPDEPTGSQLRNGDVWFKSLDNGTTQLYRYEDGVWISRDSMSPENILDNFYKNGELDANRINVVNLNANNIISGNIDTKRVTIHGDTGGTILIDGGKISNISSDGVSQTRTGANSFDIIQNVGGTKEWTFSAMASYFTAYPHLNGTSLTLKSYKSEEDKVQTDIAGDFIQIGYENVNNRGSTTPWLRGWAGNVDPIPGEITNAMFSFGDWYHNSRNFYRNTVRLDWSDYGGELHGASVNNDKGPALAGDRGSAVIAAEKLWLGQYGGFYSLDQLVSTMRSLVSQVQTLQTNVNPLMPMVLLPSLEPIPIDEVREDTIDDGTR